MPRAKRIRPQSRETKQGRIRQLRCFSEVYDRFLEGWPVAEIARFIQDIKKEATDISRAGVVAALLDFRATIPPAELTKRRMMPAYIDAVETVEKGLDELHELEKLYRLQMSRVSIDVTNEKNIKKLLPTTGQEVRIAKEILTAYADLKMDLGLSKRHIGQVDVEGRLLADVAVHYGADVGSVLTDAQARKKVLGLAQRLLSMRASKGSNQVASIEAEGELVPDAVTEADAESTGAQEDAFEEEVSADVEDLLAEPVATSPEVLP